MTFSAIVAKECNKIDLSLLPSSASFGIITSTKQHWDISLWSICLFNWGCKKEKKKKIRLEPHLSSFSQKSSHKLGGLEKIRALGVFQLYKAKVSSSRNRKENCSICIELIPWKKKTNQERKVKLMSVSCQHPHEIVYTPKAARKSFFICFSSCLLLFRLKLWKNADCALRLREQFVTSLSALFPKYYMLDEGTKGGRKWKNKQNHDSMHDFILHHFCILHYQTLHFIFATWVYKSIKFKIADFLKIIPPKRSHIWVNFNSHIFEFFMAKIDCLFWLSIAQFQTMIHCPLKKKLAHQMKWILSIPRFTSLMSSENFAKSLEFCDSFKGWKGGFKVRDGEGLAQEFWL